MGAGQVLLNLELQQQAVRQSCVGSEMMTVAFDDLLQMSDHRVAEASLLRSDVVRLVPVLPVQVRSRQTLARNRGAQVTVPMRGSQSWTPPGMHDPAGQEQRACRQLQPADPRQWEIRWPACRLSS